MRIKITDSTSIPISWVAAAYLPTTAFVISVALWVYTVDLRLARIESKLGIAPLPVRGATIIKAVEVMER